MSKNRYFVSFAEEQVSDMLSYLHIPFKRYTYVCFRCGNFGNVTIERNRQEKILRIIHPSKCSKCGRLFGVHKYSFCEPDISLSVDNKHSIIMINGPDHEKDKIIEKDATQISLLAKLGIKTFVIEVAHIDGFKKEILDYLCDCYLATSNDDLYLKMCKKPKVGLMNHATFESYLDRLLEESEKPHLPDLGE